MSFLSLDEHVRVVIVIDLGDLSGVSAFNMHFVQDCFFFAMNGSTE